MCDELFRSAYRFQICKVIKRIKSQLITRFSEIKYNSWFPIKMYNILYYSASIYLYNSTKTQSRSANSSLFWRQLHWSIFRANFALASSTVIQVHTLYPKIIRSGSQDSVKLNALRRSDILYIRPHERSIILVISFLVSGPQYVSYITIPSKSFRRAPIVRR